MQKRIFSGIQPTGIIHLGNYFGAIYNWLQLLKKEKDLDAFFSIVDYHALTVYQDPAVLSSNIRQLAKLYIACGLDPAKVTIFRQSSVPEHTELAWLLNCITPMAELERMTQYKDKSAQHKNNINAGLFTYPVLMAADILLYDTDFVPVGEDQKQHVELARVIAKKFNHLYGATFKEPGVYINPISARLRALDNPEKKMSKSAKSEYNFISLTDTPDVIEKKIKKAVTDSGSEIKYGADRPAISNLMNIYSLVAEMPIKEIEKKFAGKGYGDFKQGLTEQLVNFIKPIQEKLGAIDDNELDTILKNGAIKARKVASAKIALVREKIGL